MKRQRERQRARAHGYYFWGWASPKGLRIYQVESIELISEINHSHGFQGETLL
jgi:hypothetical protein